MPRELSWYLEELRKKRTPGNDPNNSYNAMYNTLQELDNAIRRGVLEEDQEDQENQEGYRDDEEKNRKITNLYADAIDAARKYYDQRAVSFFGPGSWEKDTGLLGDLLRDLAAQAQVMQGVSSRQTVRKNQFNQFRAAHEKEIKEDALGLSYDEKLDVPRELKTVRKAGGQDLTRWEASAAATRLAGGLGADIRVEEVVRVEGNGRDGKNFYTKGEVRGEQPSAENLASAEKFAAEGAVLDSGELARQLSEIQVIRYLTGTSGRGVDDLRFTFSDGVPKRITGITDTNLGQAFSADPAAETMTPDSLTVMSRSTADRIMSITPERLGAILGSRISGQALENARTRLTSLKGAIQRSREAAWAMDDAMLPGRLHVVEDAVFSKLSIKQIASVQNNNEAKGLFSKTYSGMVLKGQQAEAENAAFPGGLYQRQLNELMESQEGKKSSPVFVKALEAVKKVNTEINRYMHADRELTAEEMSALRKTYMESIVEVDKYIKATDRWHITNRGNRRHNAMAAVKGYMNQELKALNDYDPGHHWKIEKIIQHGRQEEIPVLNGQINRFGGNISSRQALIINGKRGAFTARTNYHSPTDQEIRRAYTDMKDVPDDLKANVRKAVLAFDAGIKTIDRKLLRIFRNPGTADVYAAGGKGFLDRPDVRALNELLRKNNIPRLTADGDEKSVNYRKHIAGRIRAGLMQRNMKGVLKGARIADGENQDQRNTAMSVVADLLEMPNAAARARDVRVKINGMQQEGTFQEWAEGETIGNKDAVKGSDYCRPNSNIMTKEALQQLSDLQALDFICGNIDRHMNNMTYKFEDINGEHRLVKITGIDNDTSFGVIKMSDHDNLQRDNRFIFPQHMLMMKQSTANAILNLTKDTLQVGLRPYIHGQGELDACWDRVQGLQKQLRADLKYPFVGKTSLTDGHIRIFRDDDPVWDSFRPGDLANSRTVMGELAKAAMAAEKTRRLGNDPAPDRYELERSVREGKKISENYRKLDLHPMEEVTGIYPLAVYIKETNAEPRRIAGFYRDMPKATMNEHTTSFLQGKHLYDTAEDALKDLVPGGNLDSLFTNEVLKEAGYKSSLDFFFVDGVPAGKYLEEHYPKLFKSQDYLKQNSVVRERVMKGMMGALMTSGRHHIDMVLPAMDSDGNFTAGITELKMDLDFLAGTEGELGTSRKNRQEKLFKDGKRAARFKTIEEKVVERMGDAAERLHANIMSGLEKPLSEKYKDILAPQPAAPAAVQPPVEQVPVNQPVVNQVPDNQVQAVPEAEKVPLNRMPGGLDLGEGAREPHSFRKEMISVDDLMPEEPKKRSGSFVKGKDPANDRKKDAGKAGEKKEDQKEEAKHEEGRRNSARSHKGK